MLQGYIMLFLYLDESGNYTFSKTGTEYLIYSSLAVTNPYNLYDNLCNLEKKLKKKNINLSAKGCFHATEDKQVVRDEVYKILRREKSYEVDSVIIEKCKANPAVRDPYKLYPKVYGILLKYVLHRYSDVSKVVIFLDEAPIQKKKDAMKKGINETLKSILGKDKRYHVIFLPAVFSYGLQAVDYIAWGLYKKRGNWGDKMDLRPYKEIKSKVKSELDLFESGDGVKYY